MKIAKSLWVVLAFFVGAIAYSYLMGVLDSKYRPFSSDMPAWIVASLPTGGIFGSVTVISILSHINKTYIAASIICIVAALPTIYFYFGWYRADSGYWSPTYALSETGPALLWSGSLLVHGLFLMLKAAKYRNSR